MVYLYRKFLLLKVFIDVLKPALFNIREKLMDRVD